MLCFMPWDNGVAFSGKTKSCVLFETVNNTCVPSWDEIPLSIAVFASQPGYLGQSDGLR